MRRIPIILLILFLSCNICSAELRSLGNMTKSTYDADRDKIVDDSERLGAELPDFYAIKSEVAADTTTLDNIKVDIAGDTMTGNLTVPEIIGDTATFTFIIADRIDTFDLHVSSITIFLATATFINTDEISSFLEPEVTFKSPIDMDSNNLLDVSTGVFVLLKASGTDGLTLSDKDGSTSIFIEDGGNVGIGSSNPGTKLDIVTGQILKSGFHLGEAEDAGGWLTSISTMQMVISAGSEFTAFGWKTKCSSPSLINLNDGDIIFYTDSGLTSGAGFIPSERMRIDKTGKVGIGDPTPDDTLSMGGNIDLNNNDMYAIRFATIGQLFVSTVIVTGDITGDLLMSRIGDSTHKFVQDMQNVFHSAGWISGGEMTENGSTVDISSGTGLVRSINNSTNTLSFFDFNGLFNYTPPSDDTVFVGVEYNNGSPRISTRTVDDFNNQTDFIIGIIIEENGQVHTTSHKHKVGDHANLMIQRLHGVQHLARDNLQGGLLLGVTGTRNVTLTAGKVWLGLEDFDISAIDTSGVDTFDRYFRASPSGFTKIVATTTFDNGFWDDGTGTLNTLSNNRYTAQYFYIEIDGELVSLYGRAEYTQLSEAENDPRPSTTPERLIEHGLLIGRMILQEGNDTPISIEILIDQTFEGSGVTSHTDITDVGVTLHPEIDAKFSSLAISTPTFQLELTTTTWLAADSNLLSGLAFQAFVSTAGDTMSGDLNLSSNSITLVSTIAYVSGNNFRTFIKDDFYFMLLNDDAEASLAAGTFLGLTVDPFGDESPALFLDKGANSFEVTLDPGGFVQFTGATVIKPGIADHSDLGNTTTAKFANLNLDFGISAATATYTSTVTALAYFGDGSALTGIGGSADFSFQFFSGDGFDSAAGFLDGLDVIVIKSDITIASYDVYTGSATTDAYSVDIATMAAADDDWSDAESVAVSAATKNQNVASAGLTLFAGDRIKWDLSSITEADPAGNIKVTATE